MPWRKSHVLKHQTLHMQVAQSSGKCGACEGGCGQGEAGRAADEKAIKSLPCSVENCSHKTWEAIKGSWKNF